MESQNQESLESENISLLHERILQERNKHFSLDSQLSQRALLDDKKTDGCNEHEHAVSQSRPRHISNTKAARMKPSSAPIPAPDMDPSSKPTVPPLNKHTTFHGFPVDMDGDTQPIPSQFYKNYTSGVYSENDESQFDNNNNTTNNDNDTTETTDNATEIDLMQHWPGGTFHEISSDNGSDSGHQDQDETQYFLSSVNRPTTFPKTPATAGHKRNYRGDVISTSSTKTPGSGGMSAFGFGKAAALSGTQLFQATQAPSSPVPLDFPRSDPVLSRPSPNLRHISSPAAAMSSPSKGMQLGIGSGLRKTSTHDGKNHEEEGDDQEGNGPDAWNPENDMFEADTDVHHSPGSVSMDEYDEYAQEIRQSQRQQSSSPRLDQSEAEDVPIHSSSRTSASASPRHNPDPSASLPSHRMSGIQQSLQPDAETLDPGLTVADSQPTRMETQPPPPLVEPSSMSSFVPGSYPLVSSQLMRTHLDALRRDADADESSPFPQPPPTTSQVDQDLENRVPSSPPPFPPVAEQDDKQTQPHLPSQVVQNGVTHASVLSQLPDTQPAMSQRATGLKGNSQQQSSNVPETDPMDLDQSSNHNTHAPNHQPTPVTSGDATLAQQQVANTNSKTHGHHESTVPSASQSKQRLSQLATQSQSQKSALTQESPRKAAGILNFAAIANGANPLDTTDDMDLNIDLLSNEDHHFMDVMSSPPPKKMRMYGKMGRVQEKAKTRASTSAAKKPAAVRFEQSAVKQSEQDGVSNDFEVEPVALINSLMSKNHEQNQHGQAETLKDFNQAESTAVASVEANNEEETPSECPEAVPENGVGAANALRRLQPMATEETPTPASENEQTSTEVPTKAHDALLSRKKAQTKTTDTKTPRGKLVRPKKRDLNAPLRTPVTRRQDAEAPKSKLRHVEGVSDGVQPHAEHVANKTTNDDEAQTADTADVIVQPQQFQADNKTDVSMADAASETSTSNTINTSNGEIIQPDRVLALFKGTGQAYYPATCLGAATLDGLKLRIRFDDGTVTQLDSFLVRRLEFRRGDQVKVDLHGMRSKTYVVVGFHDKIQDVAPDSYPKTDIYGHETIQLVPKDRDSMAAMPRADTAALIHVPCTNVYLTQTMWIRFDDRSYLPSSAIAVSSSSRLSTPVPQRLDPATPSSRSRRLTVTSNHSITRPDLASPLPTGRGVFSNMAFAVSYCSEDAASSAEKDRVIELIHAHGGIVLDKGFDELFSVRDLNETEDSTPARRQSSSSDEDALTLSTRAQSLGFVALIADRHSRRAKYIQALALSLPCLAGRWILDSVKSGSTVSWSKYLLPAGESVFLNGAVRSRTMTPYDASSSKLADTIQNREKLLQGGKVLLVSGGTGSNARKWEARRPYAFLTVALGASVVRRVCGLDSAKRILGGGEDWGWVYVEGKVEDAEKALFGTESVGNSDLDVRKRKRKGGDVEAKMVASREDGRVKVVGDEFVVQSLILGSLMV